MIELIFFVLGISVGITMESKSRHKPVILDTELQKRLSISENLNVSLRRDLNEAKEKLWKCEQNLRQTK